MRKTMDTGVKLTRYDNGMLWERMEGSPPEVLRRKWLPYGSLGFADFHADKRCVVVKGAFDFTTHFVKNQYGYFEKKGAE